MYPRPLAVLAEETGLSDSCLPPPFLTLGKRSTGWQVVLAKANHTGGVPGVWAHSNSTTSRLGLHIHNVAVSFLLQF